MIAAGVARGRLVLLRAQLWTHSRGRARARGGAASVLLALGSALALTWALGVAFSGLRALGLDEPAARTLLAWLFTATLTGVLVFDLHQALAVLVAAPDLDLLRAAPLSPRELAALRLLDALPHSLPLVLTLAVPAALAYAAAYGAPAAGAAGAVLAIAALWLAPLGAGIALALPVARLLPPARARDLLGMLATFALVAAWLANALLVPRSGLGAPALHAGGGGLAGVPAPPAWLPSSWAAEALASGGDRGGALLRLALAVIGGAALAWWGTRRHLEAALDRTQDAPRRVPAGAGTARVAASPMAAFLARDARLFGRQWSVAADVIAASLLWLLLPLFAVPLVPAGEAQLARTMLVLLAVGIGYEVGARALALERAGLAWAHLAPAGPSRWIAGRLAGIALLAAALLVPAAVAVTFGFRLPLAVLPAILEWAAAAAALSITLGLLTGAAFADTSWTHPRAMLSLPGRLAGTALLLVQIAAWLALAASGLELPGGALLLACLGAAAVFAAGAARTLARRNP